MNRKTTLPLVESLEPRRLLSTYVVTNTNDDEGAGSFAWALRQAERHGGPDTINFNIPGPDVHVIEPLAHPLEINSSVVIDGYSQPGSSPNALVDGDNAVITIEIRGNFNAHDANGIKIDVNDVTVQGLAIGGFDGAGIRVEGSHAVVSGNFIGLDPNGTTARPNHIGVEIRENDTRVGGDAPANRNIISGNKDFGLNTALPVTHDILQDFVSRLAIQGNFVGTDRSGTLAIPNGVGISLAHALTATIGGPSRGERNVISGNLRDGIDLGGDFEIASLPGSLRVIGNFVGVDVTGAHGLGNGGFGVLSFRQFSRGSAVIGGSAPGEGNVISGNRSGGILLADLASDHVIAGNLIGTDASGAMRVANTGPGIELATPGDRIMIGGYTPEARNLISGNLTGIEIVPGTFATAVNSVIQGNFIGTDLRGVAALGNVLGGIVIRDVAEANILQNLISGNGGDGVSISGRNARNNVLIRNRIGTDVSGQFALPNSGDGIALFESSDNIIGGARGKEGNVISGNSGNGISIRGSTAFVSRASGNQILGNFIGTDALGAGAVPNALDGILIEASFQNTIGGLRARDGNVIAANGGDGVRIRGDLARLNKVQNNFIGLEGSGQAKLGNAGAGVHIEGDSHDNLIGDDDSHKPRGGNVISDNGRQGVLVESGVGNTIRANSIFSNRLLGIDLLGDGPTPNDGAGDADVGANLLQNFPELSVFQIEPERVVLSGQLKGALQTRFTLEFFANAAADASGFGEGQTFLGSMEVVTDSAGQARFFVTFHIKGASGTIFTATATDPAGNTSEFSAAAGFKGNSAIAAPNVPVTVDLLVQEDALEPEPRDIWG